MGRVWERFGEGLGEAWGGYWRGLGRVLARLGEGIGEAWEGYWRGLGRVLARLGKGIGEVWEGYWRLVTSVGLERDCKKMQKKCKKMQDYLHMSKKSSIFAAELGIVPSITLKQIKDMKKRCVFKATACGEIYKVAEVVGLVDEPLWAVMKGRVYAPKPFLYRTLDEAIDRALYLAKLDLHKNDLIMYEP